MRIGVYQFAPEFGKIADNVARVAKVLGSLAADLVVLPELFSTGYLFESNEELARLAEPVPNGPTTRALAAVAKAGKMSIVAGLAEYDPEQEKYYNTAVVLDPAGYVGKYRKLHLYYKENKWFAPGDQGFQVFELGGIKVGVMVCFDWFFPESARTLALLGAQVICQPANLVLPYCQQAMITRSLENGVVCVTANRVGREIRDEEDLQFTGQSQVVAVPGRVCFRLGNAEEVAVVTEVDVQPALDKRINAYNDLFADRRPDFYRLR